MHRLIFGPTNRNTVLECSNDLLHAVDHAVITGNYQVSF